MKRTLKQQIFEQEVGFQTCPQYRRLYGRENDIETIPQKRFSDMQISRRTDGKWQVTAYGYCAGDGTSYEFDTEEQARVCCEKWGFYE